MESNNKRTQSIFKAITSSTSHIAITIRIAHHRCNTLLSPRPFLPTHHTQLGKRATVLSGSAPAVGLTLLVLSLAADGGTGAFQVCWICLLVLLSLFSPLLLLFSIIRLFPLLSIKVSPSVLFSFSL